jgi:antirestriction protein
MSEQQREENFEGEMTSEKRRPAPRVYVASLSDYNNGRLIGRWLDAAVEPEDLAHEVENMLAASPTAGAEEWAIFDHEGFGPFPVGEYERLAVVSRVARGIAEHGEAFAHWAALVGTTDPEELNRFDEAYLGRFDSLESYAEDMLDDLGYLEAVERAVPEGLQPYVEVDVAGFARDLELSGEVTARPGSEGVYVFDMTQ